MSPAVKWSVQSQQKGMGKTFYLESEPDFSNFVVINFYPYFF